MNKIKDIITLNASDLDSEKIKQSSRLYYVGSLLSKANHDIKKSEIKITISEANCAEVIIKRYAARGEKITEARLKSKMALDPKVNKLRNEHIELLFKAEKLKVAYESLKAKSDMLVNLTYSKMKEIEFNFREKAMKNNRNKYKQGEQNA